MKTVIKYLFITALVTLMACMAVSFIQRYTLVIDTKQPGETHIYFIWTDGVDL